MRDRAYFDSDFNVKRLRKTHVKSNTIIAIEYPVFSHSL